MGYNIGDFKQSFGRLFNKSTGRLIAGVRSVCVHACMFVRKN